MRRRSVASLIALVAITGMSACSNPTDNAGGAPATASGDVVSSVKEDKTIAAMLPADVKSKGTITASINADVAPIKFVDDSGEVVGLNPELLRAAAKVLGTDVEFTQGTFDAQVPGLESSRYDMIASIGDYVERQEKIDFIDYLQNGTAILMAKTYEKDEVAPDQLCGLNIGYTRGTVQQGYLETAAAACATAGQPALNVNGYQDAGAGILSVKSGQADGFWGDSPQMAYNVKNDPDLFKVVYNEQKGVLGIGIRKDNPELRDAVRAALVKLESDGTYDKLLAEYGLEDSGLPDLPVNSKITLEG